MGLSLGSVTEKLHFRLADYCRNQRTGAAVETITAKGEDIEVVELPFDQALDTVKRGEIMDGKTIMLLCSDPMIAPTPFSSLMT